MSGAAAFRSGAVVSPVADAEMSSAPLVSAIIPCLNEERTIGLCVRKALSAFAKRGIRGEVIVGDNGSTDRSVEIAESQGTRVIYQPVRGYGAAISAAAAAAQGEYLIMADADDSYDWSQVDAFIDVLEDGAELVMGNRFAGGIEPGAMPPLHRYLEIRYCPPPRAGFTDLPFATFTAGCGPSRVIHSGA